METNPAATAFEAAAAAEQTPRTVEQVSFDVGLNHEQIAAMYRQSVADGGLTMSYAERAKGVLSDVITAADSVLDDATREKLKHIGVLLVIWEGSIMLMEDRISRLETQSHARGELLKFARSKIEELQATEPEAQELKEGQGNG